MLVPFLDNANHASKEEGGGHFLEGSSSIALFVGENGAKKGEPVTLNYGERSADEYAAWYGFVPSPDCAGDSITIPELDRVVSWTDCKPGRGHFDPVVRAKCADILENYPTSLTQDENMLRDYQGNFDAYSVALSYRRAKKALLTQAVGL
jgi:hypothetical protein